MQIYLYLIYFCKHMRFPFVLIHPSLLLLRPPPPLHLLFILLLRLFTLISIISITPLGI